LIYFGILRISVDEFGNLEYNICMLCNYNIYWKKKLVKQFMKAQIVLRHETYKYNLAT